MELKKNPFYILNIPCDANRAAINAAAEELLFFEESDEIETAQLALLNPAKRLIAEMDWFPDLPDADLAALRQGIENGDRLSMPISAGHLSRLNLAVYNFPRLLQKADLVQEIIRMDTIFAAADSRYVTPLLNKLRQEARMPEVSEGDVTDCLNRKRAEIRQIITETLRPMNDSDYVHLVTKLAETLARTKVRGGIISDAVDQYEIRMHDKIRSNTAEIREMIKKVKQAPENSIDAEVDRLIKAVKQWDSFAQPIQLKCMDSGMTHEESQSLGQELQQLAVYLHNERDATLAAAKLAGAMQGVFAELPVLAQNFQKDEKILSEIAAKNREAKKIMAEIDAFKKDADAFPLKQSSQSVLMQADALGKRVVVLDRKIKALQGVEPDAKDNFRKYVYMISREAAIRAHNEHQESEAAYKLMQVLKVTFSDISDLKDKLRDETEQLRQQADQKDLAELSKEIDNFKSLCQWSPFLFSGIDVLDREHLMLNTFAQKQLRDLVTFDSVVSEQSEKIQLQARTLNKKVKELPKIEKSQREDLRKIICMIGRESAVELHNESHGLYTLFSVRIMDTLIECFGDLRELGPKLRNERAQLSRMVPSNYRVISKTSRSSSGYSSSKWTGLSSGTSNSSGTNEDPPRNQWRFLAVAAAAIILILVIANYKSPEIRKAERLINAIGTVDLYDADRIASAWAAYDNLSEEQKKEVNNYYTLLNADHTFKALQVEAEINSIATATSVEQRDKLIYAARNAYDLLPLVAQERVKNEAVLIKYETESARYHADEVNGMIMALGEITLESKAAVRAARSAYDALSQNAKQLVKHFDKLETAEQTLQVLLENEACAEAKKLLRKPDFVGVISLANEYFQEAELVNASEQLIGYVIEAYVRLARQHEKEKLYESAEKTLQECVSLYSGTGFAGSAQQALDELKARLESNEPYNGKTFRASAKGGYCELVIENNGKAAFIKLENVKTPNQYLLEIYVRANETVTVKIRDGEYFVKYAIGDTWYGEKELFGNKGIYVRAKDTLSFSTTYQGSKAIFDSKTIVLSESLLMSEGFDQFDPSEF